MLKNIAVFNTNGNFCTEKSEFWSFSINFLEDDSVILTFADNSSIITLIGACLSSLTPARLLLVWDTPLDEFIRLKRGERSSSVSFAGA